MGLKETIQRAAQTAIEATGNIPVASTYISKGVPSYDAETGEVIEVVNTQTVNVIVETYKSKEVDGVNIKDKDRKLLIAKLDLTVTPAEDDSVVMNGNKWNIITFEIDPAEALWVIQVRR